jgi:hypothetical protein
MARIVRMHERRLCSRHGPGDPSDPLHREQLADVIARRPGSLDPLVLGLRAQGELPCLARDEIRLASELVRIE